MERLPSNIKNLSIKQRIARAMVKDSNEDIHLLISTELKRESKRKKLNRMRYKLPVKIDAVQKNNRKTSGDKGKVFILLFVNCLISI